MSMNIKLKCFASKLQFFYQKDLSEQWSPFMEPSVKKPSDIYV